MNALNHQVRVSLARRLLAILYDSVVVFGLVLCVLALVIIPIGMVLGRAEWEVVRQAVWMRLLIRLLAISVMIGFHVGFWRYGGQTLGMRAWRLQVRRDDGSPLSFGDALKRYVAAWLSALAFGIGFAVSLWDKNGLTWHDKLTGTRLHLLPRKS